MMSAAGGDFLNVEDVFSTYVYTGTGTTKTISNGIDLSTEGGMTWFKRRNGTSDHQLFDSERGGRYRIESNTAASQADEGGTVWSTRTDGFNIGGDGGSQIYNSSTDKYVSWTFRKAPKFFDVVYYTGNNTGGRQIPHNLGCAPGMIFIKNLTGNYSSSSNWAVYHRSLPNWEGLHLNTTNAAYSSNNFYPHSYQTSSVFTVTDERRVNNSDNTYVAYVFAHNNGDGEFGPTGDQDIIKCGIYTGTGSSNPNEIDLGFEPDWVLIKNETSTFRWCVYDQIRGLFADAQGPEILYPNETYGESPENYIGLHPTGFKTISNNYDVNASGHQYVYMAIRRGPMASPESGSDVFAVATQNEVTTATYGYNAGFPVDMAWRSQTTGEQGYLSSRMTGPNYLRTDQTGGETSFTQAVFDDMESWWNITTTDTNRYSWMLRRAPGFFDIVCYTGDGSAGHTVNHNLGVEPEMIWVKARTSGSSEYWNCYIKSVGNTYVTFLNKDWQSVANSNYWNSTTPTSTQFTLGNYWGTNKANTDFIALLFGSVSGVSKVGSYTGTGGTLSVDCGFSSGARFILIKRTDGSGGDWRYFDYKRGIVSGADTSSKFNETAGSYSSIDAVDPLNSGFIVNQESTYNLNVSSANYIFYAIA